jgi:PAS domain S-box-containing protein
MILADLTLFGATLDEIQQLGVILGSLLAGLATAWKLVWVPSSKIVKNISSIHELVETQLPILSKLADEFKPNGGSSVKDALNRLELGQSLNQHRYRMVIKQSNVACFEANKVGEFTWVSPKLAEMAGNTYDRFLGNDWINAVYHEDRERVWDEWNEAILQKRDFSLTFRLNEINPIQIKAYATALKDAKGQLTAMIGEISI